jgi:hypothetical protein
MKPNMYMSHFSIDLINGKYIVDIDFKSIDSTVYHQFQYYTKITCICLLEQILSYLTHCGDSKWEKDENIIPKNLK